MKRIGVLSGAFNPLTRAHVALIDAARPHVDEIVCVVPRAYPHKEFVGASLEERVEMLRMARAGDRIHVSGGGLFIDMARELQSAHGPAEMQFVCGRDAAERIVGWDYREPETIERLMDEFGLLVAARDGGYAPPVHLAHRIRSIEVAPEFGAISSSEVRRRISKGEAWEHMVPEEIVEVIRRIYQP